MTYFPIRWAILCAAFLTVLASACGDNAPQSRQTADAGPAETVQTPEAATDAGDPVRASKTHAAAAAKDIQWFGYDEGLSRAKNYSKKVFLNFYADWCRYCKQMDQTTFEDKRVVAYLNENFIPVRVNSDKKPQRAAEFGVQGLPVSWFLTEKGERIGNQPGYLAADTLLPLLKFIYTDAYEQMGFNEFLKQM
jgi:thioredoxin-related protein